MNANDQILDEIKERWKNDIKWLEHAEKDPLNEKIFDHSYTIPVRDIRYLLGRLEAAERAARETAKLNSKLYDRCQSAESALKDLIEAQKNRKGETHAE